MQYQRCLQVVGDLLGLESSQATLAGVMRYLLILEAKNRRALMQ